MPKNKPKNSYKKPKNQFTLPSSTPGFLITCRRNKERNARQELTLLFDDWYTQHYADTAAGQESLQEKEATSIEDDLEAELAELRAPRQKRKGPFLFHETGIQCLIYVQIRQDQISDPVDFISSLFRNLQEEKAQKTRYTSRVVPIQDTCTANFNEIKLLASRVIQSFCQKREDDGNTTNFTWALMPSVRNNDALSKEKLIEGIAPLVPEGNTVSLKNPEFVIAVEVVNLVCGISILPFYYELKKYNLEFLVPLDLTPNVAGDSAAKDAKEDDSDDAEK